MDLKKGIFGIVSLLTLISCHSNSASGELGDQKMEGTKKSASALFAENCVSCHGKDGKLGLSGAKDLTKSRLTEKQIAAIIKNGKNGMPPVFSNFKEKQSMDSLIQYVMSFRK